jgi:hypothetical protein
MGEKDTHLMALFYSNRAAALLMLGAYQAAAQDCIDALHYCAKPTDQTKSFECQLDLVPKMHNRRARASYKMGELDAADKDFDSAIGSVGRIRSFLAESGVVFIPQSLQQELIVATTGKIDIIRRRRSMNRLRGRNLANMSH